MTPFGNGERNPTTARLFRRIVIVQTIVMLILIAAVGTLLYFVLVERGKDFIERQQRVAELEAEDSEEIARCFRSISSSDQIVAVLRGLEVVLANQVDATLAAIENDPHSPLTEDRFRTVREGRRSLRATRDLLATTAARTPTANECFALRCQLDERRTGEPLSSRCRDLIERLEGRIPR